MQKSIIIAGLTAGTLDITAACLNAYWSRGITPDRVLKYVASGAFGESAFSGGLGMMTAGLLFHFIIAFACVVAYFWLYPKLPFLKINPFLNALLIGIVAWGVTTRFIIPLSKIGSQPFVLEKALIAIGILIVCIGLPIAYIAKHFYENT